MHRAGRVSPALSQQSHPWSEDAGVTHQPREVVNFLVESGRIGCRAMASRSLHIAWLGPAPGEDGGVTGVGTELLYGLAALGHRIDCFFPSSGQKLPMRLVGVENL